MCARMSARVYVGASVCVLVEGGGGGRSMRVQVSTQFCMLVYVHLCAWARALSAC